MPALSRRTLTAPPTIVLGTAAGDVVDVDIETRTFGVLHRRQNLAVHVYAPSTALDDLADDPEQLGGWVDGQGEGVTVCTIPVSTGFAAVEETFERFAARHPGAEWHFSNVCDLRDGTTPLDWWKPSRNLTP